MATSRLLTVLQILWKRRLENHNNERALVTVTVDGVDFHIFEPVPIDSKWYSHKLNGPGLRYEYELKL